MCKGHEYIGRAVLLWKAGALSRQVQPANLTNKEHQNLPRKLEELTTVILQKTLMMKKSGKE